LPNILSEFLKDWRTTGTIAPSSRFLQQGMVAPIRPLHPKTVVELGPGTGCITTPLLNALEPKANLVAVEINQRLASGLPPHPQLKVVCDSAANLPAILEQLALGPADAVISGLPFASLPAALRDEIVQASWQALRPGGVFVAFQYTPLVLPPLLRRHFGQFKVRPVLINLPPALVYTAVRRESGA
jgi:phospholipid N-methyltransferase